MEYRSTTQQSILGPLLFVITYDIHIPLNATLTLHVGDTAIITQRKDILEAKLQASTDEMVLMVQQVWSNPTKSEFKISI